MKTALVIGAARGIGAATVDTLVADGFHVTALDVCAGPPLATPGDLDALVARYPGRVVGVVADVRDYSDEEILMMAVPLPERLLPHSGDD